jgi:hypothetical protein
MTTIILPPIASQDSLTFAASPRCRHNDFFLRAISLSSLSLLPLIIAAASDPDENTRKFAAFAIGNAGEITLLTVPPRVTFDCSVPLGCALSAGFDVQPKSNSFIESKNETDCQRARLNVTFA